MGKVSFGLIQSVDGFVNDRNGETRKLYASFEPNDFMLESWENIGAVVMGRNSFDGNGQDTDGYADSYEFQVPMFVLTHRPPVKKTSSCSARMSAGSF